MLRNTDSEKNGKQKKEIINQKSYNGTQEKD